MCVCVCVCVCLCVCVCVYVWPSATIFTDLLGNRSTPLSYIDTSKSVTMQDLITDYLRYRNPSSYLDHQKRKAQTLKITLIYLFSCVGVKLDFY